MNYRRAARMIASRQSLRTCVPGATRTSCGVRPRRRSDAPTNPCARSSATRNRIDRTKGPHASTGRKRRKPAKANRHVGTGSICQPHQIGTISCWAENCLRRRRYIPALRGRDAFSGRRAPPVRRIVCRSLLSAGAVFGCALARRRN